jgi:hypothetical protein
LALACRGPGAGSSRVKLPDPRDATRPPKEANAIP